MKKVLAVCFTVVMLMSMGLGAFAASGAFVSSPSEHNAPEILDYKNESDGCTAELIIVPYSERTDTTEEIRNQMEAAYRQISETKDLTTLNERLEEISDEERIPTSNLAVADLFDMHCEGCTNHDNHGEFSIELDADTFKDFVALLHFYNGSWETVEGAKVEVRDGKYCLVFSIGDFSPFAVVVNTHPGETTQSYLWILWVVLALLLIILLIFFIILFKRKKKEDDEEEQQPKKA